MSTTRSAKQNQNETRLLFLGREKARVAPRRRGGAGGHSHTRLQRVTLKCQAQRSKLLISCLCVWQQEVGDTSSPPSEGKEAVWVEGGCHWPLWGERRLDLDAELTKHWSTELALQPPRARTVMWPQLARPPVFLLPFVKDRKNKA